MVAYHDGGDSRSLNYQNLVFLFHDKRRAINKEQSLKINNDGLEIISSHCYFSLYAIKNYFMEQSSYFKAAWTIQTAHVAFDEELTHTREDIKSWVMRASYNANGKSQLSHATLIYLEFARVSRLMPCRFNSHYILGNISEQARKKLLPLLFARLKTNCFLVVMASN